MQQICERSPAGHALNDIGFPVELVNQCSSHMNDNHEPEQRFDGPFMQETGGHIAKIVSPDPEERHQNQEAVKAPMSEF